MFIRLRRRILFLTYVTSRNATHREASQTSCDDVRDAPIDMEGAIMTSQLSEMPDFSKWK